MNKVKIYENEEELLELSPDDAELLLCKQIVQPISAEYTQFIFNNFKIEWLRTKESQDIYKIAKFFWSKNECLPSKELFYKIFKNDKFNLREIELKAEFDKIIAFDDQTLDKKFIKNIIKTYVRSKAVYFAIMDNIEDIQNKGMVGGVMGAFEKVIQADLDEDLGIEYFSNLDVHCEKLMEVNDRIPFNYEKLDKYTYGGLPAHDTCMFLIMAQPGLGKSQFMMNIAHKWVLMNKKVLVISLEMSEEMYSRRFDALFADLNPNTLKDNVGILKQRIKGVKAGIPKGELRIKEFPTGTLTTIALKQYLKKLESTTGFVPDIIFVDYLNIMKPNIYGASTTLYEKCGKISEELRALSGERKIPLVSAIQSNRSGSGGGYPGEDIDIGNASESSGIVATTDAMIALYQLEGERELGRINVKFLKNRLGGYVGVKFPMHVNYETLKIDDWEDDESINDDVLGEVQDASSKMFKNKNDDEKSSNKNELEDL